MNKKMKIVSELKNQQEFDEIKAVMEVFIINQRVHQLTGVI